MTAVCQSKVKSDFVRSARVRNRLLAALPPESLDRLLPQMELVRPARGEVLYQPGDAVRHAWFPGNGIVSLMATAERGGAIEVGMVGGDGLIGVSLVLGGSRSLYRVTVQAPAEALRINAGAFKAARRQEPRLEELLLRYVHALLAQVSQAAFCHRFHTLEQRLCRRLLATGDRLNADTFGLTQQVLSQVLGARRTGVTQAAGALQAAGLISYRWGRITLIDRHGLEAAACGCYRIINAGLNGVGAFTM
ncbi:MAG: Crp/Fnr family transcriptional regulator [Pseudomonadota bacterium]|nr:Crp/Fnr family transcriptional regulator [Pseudomonadota bacterium]